MWKHYAVEFVIQGSTLFGEPADLGCSKTGCDQITYLIEAFLCATIGGHDFIAFGHGGCVTPKFYRCQHLTGFSQWYKTMLLTGDTNSHSRLANSGINLAHHPG